MHSRARRRGPRETGAGTLAGRMAALPVLLLVLVLLLARAPLFDVLRFGLFLAVGVTLPGVVLWRFLPKGFMPNFDHREQGQYADA